MTNKTGFLNALNAVINANPVLKIKIIVKYALIIIDLLPKIAIAKMVTLKTHQLYNATNVFLNAKLVKITKSV